jgi:hypothetical protein
MTQQNNALNVFNKVMATTDGRDKVVRTIQFGMRFFSWVCDVHGYDPTYAQHIEAYMLDARRLFRIMKEFDAIEKLKILIKSPSNGRQIFKFLAGVQQIGLCGLYFSNHALLASKLRILQRDHSIFRKSFGICFSIALLAGLLQDIGRLYIIRKLRWALNERKICNCKCGCSFAIGDNGREQQLPSDSGTARGGGGGGAVSAVAQVGGGGGGGGESLDCGCGVGGAGAAKRDRAALDRFQVEVAASLARNALDQVVAVNAALGAGATLHRGAVGAAGVVTSAIQLWQMARSHGPGARPLGERVAVELFRLSE